MKRYVTALLALSLATFVAPAQSGIPQPRCGEQRIHEHMIAQDPEWADRLKAVKDSRQTVAAYYLQNQAENAARGERTTALSAVPIIFHIIVDSAQFNSLGGTSGIIQRCNSQIAVMNADYNRQNFDSSLVPASWKPLWAGTGIQFGLATVAPGGGCATGYEIKIIPGTSLGDAGFSDESDVFAAAKTSGSGLPAWDVTKYFNVWCVNFTGGATGLLGYTVSLSETGSWPGAFPTDQVGTCMLYNVLGSTGPSGVPPAGTGSWNPPFNLGRTLTHETGHLFEIWHPWGDDNGQCPTWSSTATYAGATCTAGIGFDDGLDDTPPQSDATYGNPVYTITGGTVNDCCMMHGSTNTQPIGIACLSYMDYSDDNAMHIFTTEQAAAMAAMVLVPPTSATGATGAGTIGESYSLTQNPSFTAPCSNTSVAALPLEASSALNLYPNPAGSEVSVSLDAKAETLLDITFLNILGQEAATITGVTGKDVYKVDVSSLARGIYLVRCRFAHGVVTRKVMLQ